MSFEGEKWQGVNVVIRVTCDEPEGLLGPLELLDFTHISIAVTCGILCIHWFIPSLCVAPTPAIIVLGIF
jgi:hypothetical protein